MTIFIHRIIIHPFTLSPFCHASFFMHISRPPRQRGADRRRRHGDPAVQPRRAAGGLFRTSQPGRSGPGGRGARRLCRRRCPVPRNEYLRRQCPASGGDRAGEEGARDQRRRGAPGPRSRRTARFVAGAVGPLLRPRGEAVELSPEEQRTIFREQMEALAEGGIDSVHPGDFRLDWKSWSSLSLSPPNSAGRRWRRWLFCRKGAAAKGWR